MKDDKNSNKNQFIKPETVSWIGFEITLIILVFIAVYIFANWESFNNLSPNEWGDFLAGSIGVLAFIWLILGYFQQSKELKLNTDAIHDQKIELINQTTEYKNLIEVTLRQAIANENLVKMQKTQIENENNYKLDLVKPTFINSIKVKKSESDKIQSKIYNRGHEVYNLTITGLNENVEYRELPINKFSKDAYFRLHATINDNFKWPIDLLFKYNDKYGNKFIEEFKLSDKNEFISTGERRTIHNNSM